MSEAYEQGAHALKQAEHAARKGDLKGAERWSKTAERLAAAAERLAAAPRAAAENEEELRAEIRDRIRRLVDAEPCVLAWEDERLAYEAAVARAVREGAPMPPPLPPCPHDLAAICRGEKSSSSMEEVAAQRPEEVRAPR